MFKKLKIACLIPIRSRSTRIKNKNFSKINGMPLLEFVCQNIKNSKYIDNFYIACDEKKVNSNFLKKNPKFKFFHRSKKSASSYAKTELVINEFLKFYKYDIIILIQITNPFINSKYLDDAIKIFFRGKFQSLLSVIKSKSFLWKNSKITKPLNYNLNNRKFSQSIKGHFEENGSFYIFFSKNFLKFNNRLHGKIGTYEMPKISIHEIDDYEDLEIVKKLLK